MNLTLEKIDEYLNNYPATRKLGSMEVLREIRSTLKGEIDRSASEGQVEAMVKLQAEIKEKIIRRLDKAKMEEVIIDGVTQYQYRPNHAIVQEIIDIIKDMDFAV